MSEHTPRERDRPGSTDPDEAVATARREAAWWKRTADDLARELRAGRRLGHPTVSAALRRYDGAKAAEQGGRRRG